MKSLYFSFTTALFNVLTDAGLDRFPKLRHVLFGGERVSFDHTKRALSGMGSGRIIHVYGPTETTVYATYHPVIHLNEKLRTVPIGMPLSQYNRPIYWTGK